MKTTRSQHEEVTIDLSELPSPATDATVIDVTRKLSGAEEQVRQVSAQLAEARREESDADQAFTAAVGAGNEAATTKTSNRLEAASGGVATLRARLSVVGRLVDDLRDARVKALNAARVIVTGPEWGEARRLLEGSAKELEDAARRVRGQLANLDGRAREITSAPRPVMHTIRFLHEYRQAVGRTGGGCVFNREDTASFLASEAAEIVRAKAAVYVDPWRGLGDARA